MSLDLSDPFKVFGYQETLKCWHNLTGLFLISGATISTAGPVGAVISFIVSGVFVYLVVATIGEIATIFPVSGSFAASGDRFFDPALGFAQGWSYWFLGALTLPAELSSAGIIISYSLPDIETWVWALIFLVVIVVINLFGVRCSGEAEFFFSFLKWKSSTEGAPFAAGWPSVLSALYTTFLSYGGTELVGLTAGEAKNPRRDVPRAIKGAIGRILLCYVEFIFVISINIKFPDPLLLTTSAIGIAASPFTLVFKDAGIVAAAILIAVVSAGNTSVHATSRILFDLAKHG
ncbi:hypothetical protein BPOR_0236g00050 [Botrytis porri]|uniref:Amino acid permease/ SLC12A domain-containing protein n=1 Tax=Botrytis porri TaxID=87229 RepID=A0A4Z1KQY3_9HELO|nr:hypothetical protein BPOR_0236g00050 [Botrytis porri]